MGQMGGVKASKTTKDLDHVKSDVAFFASSIDFSSASSSAGEFNYSNFHKISTKIFVIPKF